MLVLAAGTLPFGWGWIGGGDVKLLAACALVLGFAQLVPFALYTALAGGAMALAAILLRRLARQTEPVKLPYAVAIAGGAAWLGLAATIVPTMRIL